MSKVDFILVHTHRIMYKLTHSLFCVRINYGVFSLTEKYFTYKQTLIYRYRNEQWCEVQQKLQATSLTENTNNKLR